MLPDASLAQWFWASFVVVLISIPVLTTLWALLDAAQRPRWVWALRGRSQVNWMAGIMFSSILFPIGLAVVLYYLIQVRAELHMLEGGDLSQGLL